MPIGVQCRSCGKRQPEFPKQREIRLMGADLNPAQEGISPTLSVLLSRGEALAGTLGCRPVASSDVQSIAEIPVLALDRVRQ